MNKDEAKEFAKNMSFRNAVYNAMQARCVPFRKATAIKLKELLSFVDSLDNIRAEIADLEEGISSYDHDRPWVYKDEVLEILDKHRG